MNIFRGCIATVASILVVGVALSGCGEQESPASKVAEPQVNPVSAAPPPAAAQPPAAPPSPAPSVSSWSPEALEELLAPIALYPDGVLAQVLASATKPQEVLDGGNWLLQNASLQGQALESAALAVGFTPPMVALLQFPSVVDMLCMNMPWTTELGSAFLADEAAVLDAVQRLRKQAIAMGNLQSSAQLKVETQEQVIRLQPSNPQVVYVPQYNPVAVYAPPSTAVASTTVVETGHSTGALITTGLLAFGAGILVNEVFDDDDDDYYYPRYGHGGDYYPAPYRPRYGAGFRPAHGYNPPGNYQHGFNNNNVVINRGGDDYWSRFDADDRNSYPRQAQSPITAGRAKRPELATQRPLAAGSPRKQPEGWQGQSTYAGVQPKVREQVARQRPAALPQGAANRQTATYAGAGTQIKARQAPAIARSAARDRGYSASQVRSSAAQASQKVARSQPARTASINRRSGFEGTRNSGRTERLASQQGRSSMPQGVRAAGSARRQR